VFVLQLNQGGGRGITSKYQLAFPKNTGQYFLSVLFNKFQSNSSPKKRDTELRLYDFQFNDITVYMNLMQPIPLIFFVIRREENGNCLFALKT